MAIGRKTWWGRLGGVLSNPLAVLHYRVHGRPSRIFGSSVHEGPGKRLSVALTFDDGPSESTGALLDYLAAEGIRATFFQCGLNVVRHPAMARRVREEGHEIGNHTYTHARLPPRLGIKPNFRAPASIYNELARTQEVVKQAVGVMPTLFRPPYGLRWFGLGEAQRRLGLLGVLWTVLAHDWEWPAARIAEHIIAHATPGGIVCLHDGRDVLERSDISEMLTALRAIVPALRAQGYSFETVSQILRPDSQ